MIRGYAIIGTTGHMAIVILPPNQAFSNMCIDEFNNYIKLIQDALVQGYLQV